MADALTVVRDGQLDQTAWDEQLRRLNGHLLQSWRWGEFKRRSGWRVDRLVTSDGLAMAQVLYRTRGPVSVGYIPRGPAFDETGAGLNELAELIDRSARNRRALFTVMELDQGSSETGQRFPKWEEGPDFVQPGRTVKVALDDDETILTRMHQKTRYSVRLAMRKGVQVESYEGLCEDGLDIFYALLEETSRRNEFGVHSRQYYRDFLDVFGTDALILVARIDGNPAAGLIAATFGNEAIYMYGGSSTEHRGIGAAFLVQFEAMRWARNRGLTHYDLWGIPHLDVPAEDEAQDAVPATRGDDWRGLLRFKTGFGGEIIDYPRPLERQYSKLGTRLARQYMRTVS